MGTNFYRIPKEDEIKSRKERLLKEITDMCISPSSIERGFSKQKEDNWECETPWDRFVQDTSVHLGKRSGGWKFCWNFHGNKYYSNKEELYNFIRNGRVVDEYGEEIDSEEFISMVTTWCVDGWDNQTYYKEHPRERTPWFNPDHYNDNYIDGLRVSNSTEFS
jgi:hypothetical protein